MLKKNLLTCCCFYLYPLVVFSQQFGGNPPSIHWYQINSDTARIIYPRGMDSTAQRVASVVYWLAKNSPAQLGDKQHKINIVLQTQTTIGNGYVSLAPYRSEFFLTPTLNNFDLGSTNWAEGLAVHEYRHVEQYNNFRRGISKAAYYLFGESGLLVATAASVPDWFFEGDAVYHETVTTNQGRGRIPFFLNDYKSLWLEGKDYSWMKLRNGSMKDYVPNHYPLGYLLVNYGREKYGLDFWSKVTRDASAYRGLFYPMQDAIKRYAGVDYKTFRKEAFEYYKSLPEGGATEKAQPELPALNGASQGTINQGGAAAIKNITTPTKSYVTNYEFPYQVGNDSLLFLKRTYRHRPAFFIKDANGEHRLRTRDIAIDDQFSYRAGKIVYAAYEPDARWGWKDFSVIKILDVHSGEQRALAQRTKYFEPDISPDGNKIAAVQVLPGGKSELHVLNAGDGKIIQQFHSAEVSLFTGPKFIDDSSLVTAVRLVDGRMALAIANIATGVVERLTAPSYGVLGYPNVKDSLVYFTGSFSGNDELYALRLNDKKVFRLTETSLGNYFVNGDKKLVWSAFTSDGYQLKEMDTVGVKWMEMNEQSLAEPVSPYPIAHLADLHQIPLTDIPNREFSPSKYKQGGHLFYVHSWRPYYADPDFTYSIYSDNILNNFSSELFYHYNNDDKTNGVGVNLLYGAWYPYINGGMEFTYDQPVAINNFPTTINELQTRIGLSLPLDFTSGRTYKNLLLGTNYVFDNQYLKDSFKVAYGNINYSYLHHYISWSQVVQQAVQHIYPRLGYAVSLNHRYAITEYDSYQFIGSGSIFLPGFFQTHSIVLGGSFQQRDTTNIIFSNRFAGARGYNEYYLSRMWRLSANYHFPILYPDWGFGNILYFSRVRGNAFYDFSKMYSRDKSATRDLRSVGGEIYFDTKWWNQYPLSFGFRYSYLLDNELAGPTQKGVFEFILPVVIPR